jgi:hypothetical protein
LLSPADPGGTSEALLRLCRTREWFRQHSLGSYSNEIEFFLGAT